jgi:hypothetical protein
LLKFAGDNLSAGLDFVQSALSAAHDQRTARPALYGRSQSTNQILHRSAATMTDTWLSVYRANGATLSDYSTRTAMPRAF